MSACLEARRLISRNPTRSPLLKLPLPCLNSQSGESGEPVWKTSLTAAQVSAVSGHTQWYCRAHTFVKAVHVQLSDERGNVGMLEVGSTRPVSYTRWPELREVRTTGLLRIRLTET